MATPSAHADEAPDFDEEAFLQSLSRAAGAFFVVSLFGTIVLAKEAGEAPTAVFDNVPKDKFAPEEPTLAHEIARNAANTELFLFLTLDTPYRGCLVYARAAAAIAAQCMKSKGPIVVLSKNTALKHDALKLALKAAALVAWDKKGDAWHRVSGPIVSRTLLDKQTISMAVRAEIDRVVFLDPSNPPSSVDGKFVVLDDAHVLCRTVAQTKLYTTLTTAKNCKILALAPAPAFDNGAQLAVLLNILRGESAYYTCKSAPQEDVLRTVLSSAEQDGVFYVVRTPEGYVNSPKGLVKGVEVDDFKKKLGKCALQTRLPFPEDLTTLTTAELQRRAQGLLHKTPLKKWDPQTVVRGVLPSENGAFPTVASKGDDAVYLLNAQGAFDSALKNYNPKFYAVLQEIKKSPLQTHLIVSAAAALFEQVLRKNDYAKNYVYEDAAALATLPATTTILLFSAIPAMHKAVDHVHLLEPVNPQRVDCSALHYYLYKNAKEPTADESAYENLKKQAVVNAALFELL
jgi:hypothetical protein